MQRHLYISNAFEGNVKLKRFVRGDSPAASKKVIQLCRAVRAQGGNTFVVSLGRDRQKGSWKWYPVDIRKAEGVPIIYAAYFDAPLVTHIVSACSLLFIIYRITRRDSVLIYYNFLAHYVPSLLLSRLMGRRCILDLEDGFRSDEKTLKGRLNQVLLQIHNVLCNGGAMLASSALIEQTSLRPTIVCYGVASKVQCYKKWHARPLQVLFGGALFKDTGAMLFLETLNLLVEQRPDIHSKIKFVVTGFGDMCEDIKISALEKFKDIIDYRGTVSDIEYLKLLHESHIGLCLKIPDMSMGATTFPSKVVEMAAYGLLVVSTKVSDVPSLFSSKTSVLLNEARPEDLSDALLAIVDFPEKNRDIALQGQLELTTLLSPQRVGAELYAFWRGANYFRLVE